MMKSHVVVASLCLGAFAGACTENSQNATMLVGQWVDCERADSTFTFGQDGSYAFDETCIGKGCGSEDHIVGTFEASATSVSVIATDEDGAAVTMDFTYYANDTHMIFGAAYPTGEHDGVVGTWEGRVRAEGDGQIVGSTSTMELRADNTGRLTQLPFDGSATFDQEGTWGPDEDEENAGGFELELPQENFTLSVSFQLVDDAVIGSPRYCRVVP